MLHWRSRAVKRQGAITVEAKLVCEATVMCQLVPRPDTSAAKTASAQAGPESARPELVITQVAE